ncbi:MAG: CBS domain-containing protein [Nitrospinae bacterium]|nr:CBS domain-containing protein [Nitrospinota bacterium]
MIVITTHLHADFDCVASMAAAAKLYPGAVAVFPGSQEKNVRDFLVQSEFPLHHHRLKGFDFKQVKTVVVVDAASLARLGAFGGLAGKAGVEFHVYDHHPSAQSDIPAARAVTLERGSTTTIMMEILRERNIAITPLEATLFALGIYEDTGSLTFASTRPEDFEAAAWLLRQGADLNVVSDYMSRELSAEQVDALNSLLKNIEVRQIAGQTVAMASASVERYIGDVASLATKIMDIENLNALVTLMGMEGRIHMVARSRVKEVNAGTLAENMGGGGHATAASATIKEMTMAQAAAKVWEAYSIAVERQATAGEIMIERVITVKSKDMVEEAEKLMTRYDINNMPVMEGEKVAGLITRQIVEKAIHHGMARHTAGEFMINEFETVNPGSPAHVLEEIILNRRQKQAPVVDGKSGKLVGIISRGMLLNKLYGDMLKNQPKTGAWTHRVAPSTRDVSKLMEDRLPPVVMRAIHVITDLANKNGCTAHMAGGFVRDLLLRIPNTDLDIVIEGDGMDFARKLAERIHGRARTHEKFKTAVVVSPEGMKIDVATARIEYYTHPAALPTVEMSAIRQDLYRRDFSINAMAIRLNGPKPNALLDFFGGQADIKEKLVRVLHNLSFVEDPTRAFRAVRFESRYGFTIGKQTLSLLRHAVSHQLFNRLSGSRLFAELKAILNERRPSASIKRMRELGLIKFIHHSLSFTAESERLMEAADDVLAWHDLAFPRKPAKAWFVRLMALFEELPDEEVLRLKETFPTARSVMDEVVENRLFAAGVIAEIVRKGEPSPSRTHYLLAHVSDEALLYLAAKAQDTRVMNCVIKYLGELKNVKPLVTGDDLIKSGHTPSARMGALLRDIFAAQLDGKIKTREEAMRMGGG